MAESARARDQLERILLLLPLAARDGGIALADAAAELGVGVDTVRKDLTSVSDRDWYHPPGGADEIQIDFVGDRVHVWSGGKFDRPPRLTPREALALSLGLRALASGRRSEERPRLLGLARRLEEETATGTSGEELDRFSVDEHAGDALGLRGLLEDATSRRLRCRIRYLSADGTGPSERTLDPYAIVYASGRWYAIGWCGARAEVRVFRVDRVLEAAVTSERFEAPEAFDPAEYVRDGHVFRSDVEVTARVRYSARIAPWVRERGPCEPLEGGAVAVAYPTADPGWVVRHVLAYGPDAELLEPTPLRDTVRETARRLT
ncbi:MAG: WYL domain-containing protein [Gemmatimonadota bacterium]